VVERSIVTVWNAYFDIAAIKFATHGLLQIRKKISRRVSIDGQRKEDARDHVFIAIARWGASRVLFNMQNCALACVAGAILRVLRKVIPSSRPP